MEYLAKNKVSIILTIFIFIFVVMGVYSNVMEQRAVDQSKLPEKVELNSGFQRWITNLKNKGLTIEADEFRLIEENEVYNTKWMKVYSIEEEGRKEKYEKTIAEHRDIKKVVFSPSDRLFIDYRFEPRNGYQPGEVRFYGLTEDKIINARALGCKNQANCYFDRGFFLDNDVFVISELSLAFDEDPTCGRTAECTFTFKLHVTDLKKNQRLIYESLAKELVLEKTIPEL